MKTIALHQKKILVSLAILATSTIVLSNPTDPNLFGNKLKAQFSTKEKIKKLDYDPNEIVIKYKKFVPAADLAAKTAGLGFRVNQVSARPHFTTAYINQNETVEQAIERVKRDPSVEYAEPKYKYYKSAAAPNDADFGKLWGLNNTGQTISSPSYTTNNPGTSGKDMDVLGAWDVTSNCSSVIVAVLDTGVNYNHEDLAGNMWDGSAGCVNQNGTAIGGGCPNHGWDFSSGDNDPKDEEGHGTHVAGTIGAIGNNSVGISGVCQTAKIMSVRVLGLGGGDNTSVSNGIYFAVRNGAKVINMSLGGTSFSSLIHDAIEFARTNDVLVVVAAGNEDTNLTTGSAYPCENTSANIVCIAALDQSYARATFSNYDTNATVASRTVDFGAPGANIYSSYGQEVSYNENTTGYTGWTIVNTGTSWTSTTCTTGNFAMLTNPDCTMPNVLFNSSSVTITTPVTNTSSYVYKDFTIPAGSTNVNLSQFIVSIGERQNSTTCYDFMRVNYSNSTGITSSTGTILSMWDSNFGAFRQQLCWDHTDAFISDTADTKTLTNCINSGTNCSIGYWLSTDGSDRYPGGLVTDFYLTAWAPSNTAYVSINGTSMASPNAAGVAALIRAYNPSFTYAEVLQKLIDGGQAESSLTGITRYGKAINANDSIKHLKQVTGVSVSLQ